MLLGCLAGGCRSCCPKGGLCWAVSPPGGSTHGPPRAQCGVRKGGAATIGAASSNAAPGPPCLLWQMHRCRNPAPPAPQGLRAFSPWLSTPRRLRRGVWRALGDVGAGGSSLECGQATQSSNLLPWHSVRVGAGSAGAQASYFLPVRWMCWKRVMEKAMPRICMIRMHIPTVPRTFLFSSNHIFTLS